MEDAMRKHIVSGIVVVVLGVSLAAVPASASDGYTVVKGGYFSPSSGGGFQNTNMNGNSYWEIAGGSDFLGFFGVEFGVGYLQSQNNLLEVYSVPVMLSGKVQLPILFFVPYLKAGGGAYYTHGSSKIGLGSDSSWDWGYQAGGGIDFKLGPVILGVEAKYMSVNSSLGMGNVKLEGVAATGNIGLRF
jgi:hypothetical protein